MAERDDRPVLTGLLALVGVGLVVGLVLGGAALVATQVFGLGEGESSEAASGGQSMYLPKPSKTPPPSGPLMTLAPGQGSQSDEPSDKPSKSESPKDEITLSAGQTEVSPMGQIDLTGVYPGGEGAILQVERSTDGGWQEFPVTASVSNETFSTYVQTGQTGVNKFRMRDTDSGKLSNEVTVRVG